MQWLVHHMVNLGVYRALLELLTLECRGGPNVGFKAGQLVQIFLKKFNRSFKLPAKARLFHCIFLLFFNLIILLVKRGNLFFLAVNKFLYEHLVALLDLTAHLKPIHDRHVAVCNDERVGHRKLDRILIYCQI